MNYVGKVLVSLVLASSWVKGFSPDYKPFRQVATGKSLFSATVSPDLKTVLMASVDGKANLCCTETGRVLQAFAGHEGNLASVGLNSDGKLSLIGSDDYQTVRLWNREVIEEIHTFIHHRAVTAVAFCPDEASLLTGFAEGMIHLWDKETLQVLQMFISDGPVYKVLCSANGKYIADLSSPIGGDGKAHVWDRATGRVLIEFGNEGGIDAVAFSPDSKSVLTGSLDGEVHLWNIETGKMVQTFKAHSKEVFALSFNSDGAYVFAGSVNGTITIWETATGREVKVFERHKHSIIAIAVSSDAKTMLSVSQDGMVISWALEGTPVPQE